MIKNKKGKKHNWTPETMGECAKTFMDQISFYFYNYESHDAAIEKLLDQYSKIEQDVAAMPREERKKFDPQKLFQVVQRMRSDKEIISKLVDAGRLFASPALINNLALIENLQAHAILAIQEILDETCR